MRGAPPTSRDPGARFGLLPLGVLLLAAGLAAPARGASRTRLERTRYAVDDLARVYNEEEPRGHATLYHRIPILVGRQALADIEGAPEAERDQILDHVYEACLWAKLAILETAEGRRARLDVPPPHPLAELAVRGGRCRRGDEAVLPVAIAPPAPPLAAPFFSEGELSRTTPAPAGATPASLEQTEVFRAWQEDPQSRRIGWDSPAGGFVRDATPELPAVLTCIEAPRMREAIARETAKALAAEPGDGRPLFRSLGRGYFYTDYSPLSSEGFVAWLKARYKTIRVLNAVWGTDFEGFGRQLMPTPDQAPSSPSRWYDWVLFNEHRLTEHMKWARDNVRRLAPDTPLGLGFVRYLFAGSFGLSGIDPVALADLADVVEIDGADAMQADLAASLAGGTRALVDGAMAPAAFGVLPHFLHGCAAVRLAAWPPAPLRGLEDVLAAETLLREALDARRLAAPLAELARAERPVGLLYSLASMQQAPPWSLRAAETPYTRGLAAAWQACRFLDVGCQFVVSRDKGRPQTPVVVVAGAPVETDAMARNLVDHVELGGHLVVIAESLVSDERGREADYLLRLGIEVLETSRPAYGTRPRPERGGALDEVAETGVPQAAVAPDAAGPIALAGHRLRGLGPRQRIQVNVRHQVLAAFDDGSPAIVGFQRGKGRVTYLAMPLEPRDLAPVLRAVLDEAGVRPIVRPLGSDPDEAWGIECRSVRGAGSILACLWNTTAKASQVFLQGPPAASARNLSTGQPMAVAGTENNTLGPVRLAPFETVLVEIVPR